MMLKFHADEAVKSSGYGVFGAVDVGQGVLWWDYGILKLYHKNALMMAER